MLKRLVLEIYGSAGRLLAFFYARQNLDLLDFVKNFESSVDTLVDNGRPITVVWPSKEDERYAGAAYMRLQGTKVDVTHCPLATLPAYVLKGGKILGAVRTTDEEAYGRIKHATDSLRESHDITEVYVVRAKPFELSRLTNNDKK